MQAVARFIRLRTDYLLFLGVFTFLVLFIFLFTWTERLTPIDLSNFVQIELVEIQTALPQNEAPAEATITSLDNIEIKKEEKVKEKEEKPEDSFGDMSLNYGISQINAITEPKIISSPPEYPKALQKAGVQGTVLLKIGIDETGKIVYGEIIQKVHPVLDKLILDWIKKAKATPALNSNGQPIAVTLFFPAKFTLQ